MFILNCPNLNLNKIIVPNSEIHDNCNKHWNSWLEEVEFTYEESFGDIDRKFLEFKKSAQKEVNYLVKEFECK